MQVLFNKVPRELLIEQLRDKWGPLCFLGNHEFAEGQEITLDHWIPKIECVRRGWTYEQTWDVSNLRLSCKPCNARKGDLVPVDDVTVPRRRTKEPVSRAVKRQDRPEVCPTCDSGRRVAYGDFCGVCGSGPMPEVYPQYAKTNANDCDHELFWCWACSIGIVTRKAAVITVLDGEYLDE